MPCFSKEDWTPENATRLNLIIMTKMSLNPFSSFKDLEESQKKKYNRLLNQYIQSLGDKGVEQLKEEFDQLVTEDILTEKFRAELCPVQILNTEPQLLLREDQKEFWETSEREREERVAELMRQIKEKETEEKEKIISSC